MTGVDSVENKGFPAATDVVGDAVGVENRFWFIAVVNHNSEKAVHERLAKMGIESYVAKQQVVRIWKNGRRSKVDKVVIPSRIFIKCTEAERRSIVALPFINRFMTDRASTAPAGLHKPMAVVPQQQIDTLRFMLGQSDVPIDFVDTPFRVSDKVVVIRGSLKGIHGEVIRVLDGKSEVLVGLGMVGAAKMIVDTIDLELLK